MAEGFVLHLGGGLYVDGAGRITAVPQIPDTQVYRPAGTLTFAADKLRKSLAAITAHLDGGNLPGELRSLRGYESNYMIALKVAELGAMAASIAMPPLTVFGIVLTLLGELTQDDGISPEVENFLQGLKEDMKAIDDRLIAGSVQSIYTSFHTAAINLRTILQDIVVQKLTGSARIPKFVQMQSEIHPLGGAISKLITHDWSPLFRLDDYKEIHSLSPLLFTRQTDGSFTPFHLTAPVRRFDYRLGVPIFAYTATAYPLLVSAGLPWYRSAGSHALRLRELANAIDAFATRMYSECLARTIHTAQSMFQWEGCVPLLNFLPGVPSMPPARRRATLRDEYLVGAVDLVRYSDGWFADEFGRQLSVDGYDTGMRGAFDYSWPRDGRTTVTLDDPTVAQANEQAALDFADLQVASGMIQLLVAAARLRYLSTPPLSSETVRGRTLGGRRMVDTEPTTARSPWIFPSGQIERPATLQRFEARAQARIETQPPGYPFMFNYRVRLVSIENQFGDAWGDREYRGNIWNGDYVAASGDPRDKRLDVQIHEHRLLSSHLLYEGPSPATPKTDSDTVSLKASTFDWYVPTRKFLLPWRPRSSAATIKAMKAAGSAGTAGSSGSGTQGLSAVRRPGSTSVHLLGPAGLPELPPPGAMQTLSGDLELQPASSFLENGIGDLVAEGMGGDDAALEGAERRWVRTETVQVDWQLTWQDGFLIVTVTGQPEDRPCQLHIVVEEDVYSGESMPENVQDILAVESLRTELHSAFPVELVNQLMIVPKDFFDAERDALAWGEKLWHDTNERFAKSRDVLRQPPSPVEFQRSLNELIGDSMATATLAEKQNRRFAFMREHAPEVVESVMRDNQVERAEAGA